MGERGTSPGSRQMYVGSDNGMSRPGFVHKKEKIFFRRLVGSEKVDVSATSLRSRPYL